MQSSFHKCTLLLMWMLEFLLSLWQVYFGLSASWRPPPWGWDRGLFLDLILNVQPGINCRSFYLLHLLWNNEEQVNHQSIVQLSLSLWKSQTSYKSLHFSQNLSCFYLFIIDPLWLFTEAWIIVQIITHLTIALMLLWCVCVCRCVYVVYVTNFFFELWLMTSLSEC